MAVALSLLLSVSARAVTNGTWAGTSNPWSTVGSTGWTNGVVPNGVGDSATDSQATASTNQSIDVGGGVTVGNITANWGGTVNKSWQITLTNSLTMNQDGAGAGSASIMNAASSSMTGNTSIFINPGTFVLADNLFLSNTSNSTRTSGSIRMRPTITGNGSIWIENVSNDPGHGQITFEAGGNYGGNTTIASGATTFTRGDAFSPNPANVVTIGATGKGSATLVNVSTNMGNMENNFVAAANTGGTSVLGSTGAGTGNFLFKPSSNTSSIRLDGDLSFTNPSTNAGALLTVGEPITGVGKMTKIGAGAMRVTESNTYQGGTVVSAGSLAVGTAAAINNGFGFYPATSGKLGTGDVTVASTAAFLEIESDVVDAIADTANVNLAGGGSPGVADAGYMKLDGAVNEIVHTLILNGAGQAPGTYGSSASSAEFTNDEFFSGSGILTVTSDVPEPASLSLFGIAAAGLLGRRRRRCVAA
jgi:autotransporter-associated beta strand protein